MVQTINCKDNKGVVVKKVELCNELVNQEIVKGGEIVNHSYISSDSRDTLEKYIESKDGVMPTITTRPDILGYAEQTKLDGLRIRKLTPKECWRLMDFNDETFEKARQVNSDAQLYKQAGNSIVVCLIEKILNNLSKEAEQQIKMW